MASVSSTADASQAKKTTPVILPILPIPPKIVQNNLAHPSGQTTQGNDQLLSLTERQVVQT